MRKAKRQRDPEWALEVFRRAPFVTISMTRPDGTPYGVPVNMACKDEKTFYFHCAGEGEKLDCLAANPVVSLSAVSKCTPCFEPERENFTEHYRSAIALGRAETVTDDSEKTEALRLLCERFLPREMAHFDSAVKRSLARTTIIRIAISEPIVGKEKG